MKNSEEALHAFPNERLQKMGTFKRWDTASIVSRLLEGAAL